MVKAYVIDNEPDAPQGLRDDGHVILSCSSCLKKLVDIQIIKKDARRPDGQPFVWKGIAHCCYCGDKSFEQSWKGRFIRAGYSKNLPGNEDFTAFTDIKDEVITDEVIHFYTEKKAEQNG